MSNQSKSQSDAIIASGEDVAEDTSAVIDTLRFQSAVARSVTIHGAGTLTRRAPGLLKLAKIESSAIEWRKRAMAKEGDERIVAQIPRTGAGLPGFLMTNRGRIMPTREASSLPQSAFDGEKVVGVNPLLGHITIGNSRLAVHAGVIAIIAPSGAGKTPMAMQIADLLSNELSCPVAEIPFSEPFSGYNVDDALLPASILAAMYASPVVYLDSLKDIMLDSAGGAAAKGGLSRMGQKFASRISVAASNMGCVVVVPMNPSSKSPDVMNEFVAAVESSVTTCVTRQDTSEIWNWSARPAVAAERETGSFRFSREATKPVVDAEEDHAHKGPAASINTATEPIVRHFTDLSGIDRVLKNAQSL